MTDQIAFIGVGNMGNPMADQLVKAGKKVKVYDVSPEMIKKANGMRTIPQIFFDDHHVGGYVELRELEKNGELSNLLE